jgi:RimJ/RimL family protein N-acetyltransferase
MIIKTKQFILRPFKLSDAADLAKNINDWDIIKCLALEIYPYGLKHAQWYLKKTLPNYNVEKPESLVFAIVINNEVVGSIGLHHIEYGHQSDMGYWLAKKCWGQGIMTRVVKVYSAYAFKRFKLKRLSAKVFTFNQGSKTVLEKNGFKLEGILKKGALKNGKFIDEFLFAKIK